MNNNGENEGDGLVMAGLEAAEQVPQPQAAAKADAEVALPILSQVDDHEGIVFDNDDNDDAEEDKDDEGEEERDDKANEAQDGIEDGPGGGDGGGSEGGSGKRSKQLDEGYYEIEAVRRKRVRKGQLQYLIKWRDWPETANTWEPLENLMACSDVIDAFEESLRLGKQRASRKRKRKTSASHFQSKKKQQCLTFANNDYVTAVEGSAPSVHHNDVSLNVVPVDLECTRPADYEGENFEGDVNNLDSVKQAKENGCLNSENKNEASELDTKLIELKGTVSSQDHDIKKLAIKESEASDGSCIVNGLPKVDCLEPVQTNRCIGSRRRKSGSVKRFKQESDMCAPNEGRDGMGKIAVGTDERLGLQNPELLGCDLSYKYNMDGSRYPLSITEIIKPISYSTSELNNVQEVSVTFSALRSDGKEVTVDNKYLKANNPLLLINFYEKHLRYGFSSPTP